MTQPQMLRKAAVSDDATDTFDVLEILDIRAVIAQTEYMLSLVRSGVITLDPEALAGQLVMLAKFKRVLAAMRRRN